MKEPGFLLISYESEGAVPVPRTALALIDGQSITFSGDGIFWDVITVVSKTTNVKAAKGVRTFIRWFRQR